MYTHRMIIVNTTRHKVPFVPSSYLLPAPPPPTTISLLPGRTAVRGVVQPITLYFPYAAFPLENLNLMDHCHVTDYGISHVSHMTSLSVLTLSRTKLTDQGMPYLAGTFACHCTPLYCPNIDKKYQKLK